MDSDAKLRPLYLGKILFEQTDEEHFLTTAQLMQILEEKYGIKSHRQTIKSDIELLQRFGMDIQEIKSTQNRYNLVGRQFDIPELKLLIDALESSKFITRSKCRQLVNKITSLTSYHSAELIKRNIICEDRIKPNNEQIYYIVDAINRAINENKKISFQYFRYNVRKEKKLKHNGEPYIITPLHLVWNGDYYYMVGVYDYKQRLGSFRVDRIAKIPVILMDDGTQSPEGFDINEYINTTFRMFNSDRKEVELICSNDVMDSIIDRFGENITIYAHDLESFRIIVNIAVSHIFYSWIFGFGGKIKIRGPIEVKEQYTELLYSAIQALN